jgi:hypothetical protein
MESRNVGMRGLGPAVALGLAEGETLDETDGVGIPRGQIEVAPERPVVELVEEAHEVMGDPAARRMFPDDVALHPVIGGNLGGLEAPEIQPGRRIGFGDRQIGQRHLIEALQVHGPEGIAPGLVQLVGGLIAAPQPVAEGGKIDRTPGQDRVMTAVFVVRLPADQPRMLAISAGEDLDDAAALLPVDLGGERIVTARAETAGAALLVHRQDLGERVDQPLGRGAGGRAENDPEPRRRQHIHGPVKPAPVELPALWLVTRPGELADTHEIDANLAHAPGIIGPPVLRPVFRIVTDTKHQRVRSPLRMAWPCASKRWQAAAGMPISSAAPGLALASPPALTEMSLPSARLA